MPRGLCTFGRCWRVLYIQRVYWLAGGVQLGAAIARGAVAYNNTCM